MVWIIGFKYFLGWKRLLLFGCCSYVKMTRYLLIKFFSLAGNLSVYNFDPIMAISTIYEEPRPVYESFYTVGWRTRIGRSLPNVSGNVIFVHRLTLVEKRPLILICNAH
jgi:hypothetical protein